ncbi:MAG TPA: hypothetical protein VM865_02565 [Acidobacteriaceae bacterium]|jgi:hypothetical protein|nr:hypothetical protein [Acidobacteriaceae bacterium]
MTSGPLPDVTGNWQIQSGPGLQSAERGVVLLGALQSSGKTVSGTFRFADLVQPFACGLLQVVAVSGSVDANRNLTLVSAGLPDGGVLKARLAVPTAPTTFASGTIEVDGGGGCAVASQPAIGVEIPPATGTYGGALTTGTLVTPGAAAGTATLTLIQTTVPAGDGQFPVTGTLAYTVGSCTGTVTVSGNASGVDLDLVSDPTPSLAMGSVYATLHGTLTPTAAHVSLTTLKIDPSPCSSDVTTSSWFTGTLTRQ